ncbi:MAG: phytanoyl-CoA dioxygenase family protein [Chitinophagales bacterium]
MHNIFKNEKLNNAFLKYGYVCIDLLTDTEIKALNTFYNNHKINAASGFHTTHFSTDRKLKKSIHHYIIEQVWPLLDRQLQDFTPVFANFMIKEAHHESIMPLHADWTYVDESKHLSIAAWIPLCDTNENNGTLGVIPFSQHLSKNIRGPRILQWEHPFNDKIIEAAGKLINMKAGQAIIYNHRLLHFSPPNKSNKVRPALNLSIVPNNIELIHYTIPEGFDQILKYKVENQDFYLDYDNFKVPEKGELLENLDKNIVNLLNNDLNNFLSKYHRKNIAEKIKRFFQT